MQRTDTIAPDKVRAVIEALFAEETIVFEGGGCDYDQWPTEMRDVDSVLAYIEAQRARGYVGVHLATYYPACGGFLLRKETPIVDPTKFKGAKVRREIKGWGLLYLYLTYQPSDEVKVDISVNSAARARNWAGTIDEMGAPASWDWKLVEKHARRAIHVLRKHASAHKGA